MMGSMYTGEAGVNGITQNAELLSSSLIAVMSVGYLIKLNKVFTVTCQPSVDRNVAVGRALELCLFPGCTSQAEILVLSQI